MMKQYWEIKRKYKDCLLFFRLGDFYELFLEDAHIGSQVLGITLTGRPRGKDGKIPMAGVPFHAVDTYLSKLVKAGYKVAICEQITEPNKKGIVERDVVRVVTPGTILDEQALTKKEHNYICAINLNKTQIAIAYCDITTGDFWVQSLELLDKFNNLTEELSRTKPAECILPINLYEDKLVLSAIKKEKNISVFPVLKWSDFESDSTQSLKKHFNVATLAGFNLQDKSILTKTAGTLLSYLKETQKSELTHIKKILVKNPQEYVHLDRATIINLELFSTIRERESVGSLLETIDKTQTAMGGRLLKNWMLMPLTEKAKIEKRINAVEELLKNERLRKKIGKQLSDINDLERILGRISVRIGNARDLISIASNIRRVFEIKHPLVESKSNLLTKIQKDISTNLWSLVSLIEDSIVPEPPIHLKEGGIINSNIDSNLDELRKIVSDGKAWISDLEKQERERSGISSLKLRFNKVFGFYIEISKANLHLVPDNYIRKQTLVNGERFITEELKVKEDLILKSEDKIKQLEYAIYNKVLDQVLTYTSKIQKAADAIALLDCLYSFSENARENRYSKPTIVYSNELRIKEGRHPVVEKLVNIGNFVPNSINFGPSHASLYLITGPNMAGKSVYIRQTAVITLLALMGSYVPAKSAQIPLVDAIFVRSGASDVITSGLSTFMVEMVETAYILNNATERSLIIMDEIGRGTSTFDGVSIAWATAEYLAKHFKQTPKTLFATHYFELTNLENKFPEKIKNLHMEVIEENGEPAFLHTIKKGAASKSFGVAVASLAGMPKEVIVNATMMLSKFEEKNIGAKATSRATKKIDLLKDLDLDNTTPIEALNLLTKLKKQNA